MVDRHWEELRTAKVKGKLVGWASYCGGIGAADEILRVAESIGDLSETCSYHRLHTGMIEAILKGIPINEQAKLPMPDVMICGRYCTEQAHYSEAFYRKLGIRIIPVEMLFFSKKKMLRE